MTTKKYFISTLVFSFSLLGHAQDIESFKQRVKAIEAETAKANYYTATALIEKANILSDEIGAEIPAATSSHINAVKKYNETFGFLDKIFNSKEVQRCEEEILPLKNKERDLVFMYAQLKESRDKLHALAQTVAVEVSREWGVCDVFNPETGLVERRSRPGAIAGVYNPVTKQVEWKEASKGVAGVYNPNSKKVEWKTDENATVAGVYNPQSKKVEWKSETEGGVAGIYNPSSLQVVWRTEPGQAVAGVYNSHKKKVDWITEKQSGVSIVDKRTGISSCGFYFEKKK